MNSWHEQRKIRIAVLDLYEGQANQGMRCIREIIHQWCSERELDLFYKEFDVRQHLSVPDSSFDLYISSGGPGSPLESEGSEWEAAYFKWLGEIEDWNTRSQEAPKKHVFFICHSFQLICRHYAIGNVCKRKSTAFGVFPVHMLDDGIDEPVFEGLHDPFYTVDSRDYQVIEPDISKLRKMGASILAIEKTGHMCPMKELLWPFGLPTILSALNFTQKRMHRVCICT